MAARHHEQFGAAPPAPPTILGAVDESSAKPPAADRNTSPRRLRSSPRRGRSSSCPGQRRREERRGVVAPSWCSDATTIRSRSTPGSRPLRRHQRLVPRRGTSPPPAVRDRSRCGARLGAVAVALAGLARAPPGCRGARLGADGPATTGPFRALLGLLQGFVDLAHAFPSCAGVPRLRSCRNDGEDGSSRYCSTCSSNLKLRPRNSMPPPCRRRGRCRQSAPLSMSGSSVTGSSGIAGVDDATFRKRSLSSASEMRDSSCYARRAVGLARQRDSCSSRLSSMLSGATTRFFRGVVGLLIELVSRPSTRADMSAS